MDSRQACSMHASTSAAAPQRPLRAAGASRRPQLLPRPNLALGTRVKTSAPHIGVLLRAAAREGNEPEDWFAANADLVRAVPLAAGGLGIVGVLLNRVLSGIAPVVDASSSQSRTDVLVIVVSASLLLTGLSWLSVKPKPIQEIQLQGQQVWYQHPALPAAAATELSWAWQALSGATRAVSIAVFWRGTCVMQAGVAPDGSNAGAALPGPICERARSSGKGTYFANLAPYPGRVEFAEYLPANTPAAIVQPVGDEGVAVVGGNALRGFSRLDQAWVAAVCDKLGASLEEWVPSGKGFSGGSKGKLAASARRS